MTRRLDHSQLLAREEIVRSPTLPSRTACDDHSFELPTGLYIAAAGLFLGFVTVLTLAFGGHMAVSYGVIAAFIAAFFAVPTIFAHAAPDERSRTRALGWYEFLDEGMATATGRCSGTEAAVLVLLLPFLIFCFGVAVAAIGVLVS
jgi:hypothetical protein